MASLQGWGRQTWNSGAWDTFAPVNATGNGLSSSVGTVSLVTTNVFGVTGFQIINGHGMGRSSIGTVVVVPILTY